MWQLKKCSIWKKYRESRPWILQLYCSLPLKRHFKRLSRRILDSVVRSLLLCLLFLLKIIDHWKSNLILLLGKICLLISTVMKRYPKVIQFYNFFTLLWQLKKFFFNLSSNLSLLCFHQSSSIRMKLYVCMLLDFTHLQCIQRLTCFSAPSCTFNITERKMYDAYNTYRNGIIYNTASIKKYIFIYRGKKRRKNKF